MSSKIFVVTPGTPVYFRPSDLAYSFCVQPGAAGTGGTATLQYSIDNGFTYFSPPQSGIATPFSFSNISGVTQGLGIPSSRPASPPGVIIQVNAATQNANFIASDISLPLTFGADKTDFATTGVAYSVPNVTTETTLFSMRFAPNYLPLNSTVEIEYWLTLTNNANVKTIKAYVGPTNYVPATGLEGGTLIMTQAVTSFSNFIGRTGFVTRNDGQTILGQNLGSAGGFGGNTTASVVVANTNYNTAPGAGAVEQVFTLTGTKATGTDALTLDHVRVSILS